MRNVDPDDLDHLAAMLDGRGGVQDRLHEAFTRASALDVTATLARLRPLRTWVSHTAPDLRTRAAVARLEDDDPTTGLRWAGFGTRDIARLGLAASPPGFLLVANALAISGDPRAEAHRRRPNESLDSWADRLRADEIARIPALAPYKRQITALLTGATDAADIFTTTMSTVLHGTNVTTVVVGNSLAQGALNTWKLRLAAFLRGLPTRYSWAPDWVDTAGRSVAGFSPPIKSLSAPGTWLPSRLASLANGSSTFQQASNLPVAATRVNEALGTVQDLFLRSSLMSNPVFRNISPKSVARGLAGDDRLARLFGGETHSGQAVNRAGQASLWKMGKNSFTMDRSLGKSHLVSMRQGARIAARGGGLLRGFGVASGAASTAYSTANVWVQGNPVNAFRRKGAGYVADVAEVGLDASLTAATVAPNPFTIGALAATGGVYVGAEIVEHWDEIRKGADIVGRALTERVNPAHWF